MKDTSKLIKMFFVFFVYFLYSRYAGFLLKILSGIDSDILIRFIIDIAFMVFIIFMYRGNLVKDFKKLKKDYSIKKIIFTIIKWLLLIFVFIIVCGFITDLILPGYNGDDNTTAVYKLNTISTWYTIFKTMIFASLAEEILYREALRDNIKNNFIFIIISAIVYTVLNIIFAGFTSGFEIVAILAYLLPALFWSTAYVRNDSNILLLALIKFVYNLIPLTIMLLGLGA